MKRSDFLKVAGMGTLTSIISKSRLNMRTVSIKPARLRPGDTVALTAPAGIVHEDSEFERMKKVLGSFGFHVRFGEFVKERYGYFAGTDHQRALDLNRFFADPEVQGIIAVRGGWGCSRILNHLDFELIRENPKVYCGFSDNTTLHLALRKYAGLISYHGPNGTSEWTDLTRDSFRRVLMEGEKTVYEPLNGVEQIRSGIAEGPLIGGNLSIFVTSLGTPYQPDTGGSILFLEDIGEPAYKIDRMMTHLKHAGVLEHIKGFIFGQCTECSGQPSEDDFTMLEVLEQHVKPLGIPAVVGVDIGHNPDNITIPLGVRARLDASGGVLELLERGVV